MKAATTTDTAGRRTARIGANSAARRYGRAAQMLAATGGGLLVALHALRPQKWVRSRASSASMRLGLYGGVMRITFFACGSALLCLGRADARRRIEPALAHRRLVALPGWRRDDSGRCVLDGRDDYASRPDDARGPAPRVYRDDWHAGAADWRGAAGVGRVACRAPSQGIPGPRRGTLVCGPHCPGRQHHQHHGRGTGDLSSGYLGGACSTAEFVGYFVWVFTAARVVSAHGSKNDGSRGIRVGENARTMQSEPCRTGVDLRIGPELDAPAPCPSCSAFSSIRTCNGPGVTE